MSSLWKLITPGKKSPSASDGISAVAGDLLLIEQSPETDVDVFAFEEKIF